MSLHVSVHASVCPYVHSPLYLSNEWRYFNETGHSSSLASADQSNDIEDVIRSEIEVIQ